MFNNLRKFKAIKEAKEAVFNVSCETDNFEYWDKAIEVIRRFMSQKMSILDKQAVMTVFLSGTFTNGDGFMMPSTRCCTENFKSVCHDLKKKRQLYILVYDPDDVRADSDGYFSVGIF